MGSRRDDEDLFEYLGLLWRYRVMITALCVVSVLLALVTTLRATRIHEARVAFLAPLDAAAPGQLGAASAMRQMAGIMAAWQTPGREVLVAILRSRTMAEAVVARFRLEERNERRSLELAIASLRSATEILTSREGVSITISDPDPVLAADIANFYVEELERIVARYWRADATRQREYLAEQRARAQHELRAAEAALRTFQERNHTIVLQDQTRSVIEAAARLRGEIAAGEVRLAMLRSFATETNPDVIMAKRELEEKKLQLLRVQHGDGRPAPPAAAPAAGRNDITVPFARVPALSLELSRLLRDVKVHETVVALLSDQIEQVRLAEAGAAQGIRVLDPAIPAERHSRPRLGQNLALAGGLSLFSGVFLALFLDYLKTSAQALRRQSTP